MPITIDTKFTNLIIDMQIEGVRMDEWMDGWMNGGMDGWIDTKFTKLIIDRQID